VSNTTLTTRVSGKMSSRGWAIALGIGAVVLAAILLVVYLDRYRSRVSGENAPTPVLVAKQLIPRGTSGSLIASQSMYAPTTLPRKEVEVGAVSDPQYLVGRAAAADVLPGQQFTAVDFAASDTSSVDSQITGTQRGVALSLAGADAVASQVQAGDSVDVYVQLGGVGGQALVKLFRPNVKVLAVPSTPGPVGSGNLIVRVDTRDVSNWEYAANNAKLVFVVRPVTGAKPTKKSSATAASVLR
jgi:Flp pilus assembly protein CpaB